MVKGIVEYLVIGQHKTNGEEVENKFIGCFKSYWTRLSDSLSISNLTNSG